MDLNEDVQYFNLIRQGDTEALSKLYLDYYDNLKHYGMRIHNDTVLIEGCIQDMFISIFDAGEKLGQVNNVKAYLYSSLRRRVLKALDAERKLSNKRLDYMNQTKAQFTLDDIKFNLDITEGKRNAMVQALNDLSWHKREAIYLRYYNGLSTKEIGVVMGISNQTVLNTIYQGLSKVRKIVNADNYKMYLFPLSLYVAF